MVTVEIENGLYDIMDRPALESVEKEAKISLATRNESKWASIFDQNILVQGKSKISLYALLSGKDEAQEP